MKRITFLLVAVATVSGVIVSTSHGTGHADQESAAIFVTQIPPDTAIGS